MTLKTFEIAIPPPENAIISSWDHESDCMVSICMLTYNHEKYICDALNGILNQKTNFPIELLVHDDASTDNTANVIIEYAKNYPRIIKPILQQKNQYSKGINPSVKFNYPRAQGKFIAICEGDDFWIDEQKLAIQITAMRREPRVGISFHPAIKLDYTTEEHSESLMGVYSDRDCIIPFNSVIHRVHGWIPTASTIITQETKSKLLDFMKNYPFLTIGDIYLQFFGSINFGAIYINRTMSVYRYATEYSWTRRVIQNKQGKEHHELAVLKSYIELSRICQKEDLGSIKLLIIQRLFWLFSNENLPSNHLPEILIYKKQFDKLLLIIKNEIHLLNEKSENVIIYGAGQGCALIMQYINPELVRRIIDRDESKSGQILHGREVTTIYHLNESGNTKIFISIFAQGNQSREIIINAYPDRNNDIICLDQKLIDELDIRQLYSAT